MDIDLTTFPSTRYQGSKRKVVPWLHDVFSEIEFDSALDLFGGSATVSYLLKRMGKAVSYNDLLHFNYLIGVAIIENNIVKLGDRLSLLKPGKSKTLKYRFVQETFKGFYFTDYENAWIDRAVCTLESLSGNVKDRSYKRAIGYYALFQACLIKRPFNLFHRKNLYLRTANVDRTFGNKRMWDTSIASLFKRFAREANDAIFTGERSCTAYNHDAQYFPSTKYDLVYLDPPYVRNKRGFETSDYLTCYHFLEGLSRYERWSGMLDHASSILAMKKAGANPFTDPLRNRAALRSLFERFEKSTLVISYKKFGTPSISWFTKELQRLGKRVSYRTRHYKYALNHQNGDAARNRELVIVAQ